MSETNIFSYYVGGQCLNEPAFDPSHETCIHEEALIATLPPDRGAIKPQDEFVLKKQGRNSGFSFLVGCVDNHTDPPGFENPDIQRISNDLDGSRPNNNSVNAVLSADGRFAAFQSFASDLIDGDNNDLSDIFVYDRENNSTERVSVASDGNESDGGSYKPSISADGRSVSFTSVSGNIGSVNNGKANIFVRDRDKKETRNVSVSSSGEGANNNSFVSSISADGRYVAFNSSATNLAPPCTSGIDSVFIHDRQSKKTVCASVAYDGWTANGGSGAPSISGDGGSVVFGSWADNLVASKDENGSYDIFIRNMADGAIKMLSAGANGNSGTPRISADGKTAVFWSQATNLTPNSDSDWWKIFTLDADKDAYKKCSGIVTHEKWNEGTYSSRILPAISVDGRYVAFDATEELTPDDTNGVADVFVCDTESGKTARVSKAKDGGREVNDNSGSPDISGDGRFISFQTWSYGSEFYADCFIAKNPLFKKP
ncbi:MAG: hypothetical protein COV46_00615 [Deltaproteobacteria bacterium CG11_big_fil_rev_8_21_14_0_20_49_13]|nr:MAG: hypothetical protein COV46_00615 [Deltaproteobacteria bacterium CG11_big_fil_rev_8_21_14_0_20_49_13]